jgi:hypothetical protein
VRALVTREMLQSHFRESPRNSRARGSKAAPPSKWRIGSVDERSRKRALPESASRLHEAQAGMAKTEIQRHGFAWDLNKSPGRHEMT